MEKLLSVIIPVYNGEKWVQRAVKSVVDQPCSNYIEIILINDGSTDDSAQVCEKIANENENVIVIHKKNEGVSVARNTGIKNAKGKYLAFLDCDDWWEKDFFDDEILNELKNDIDIFGFSHKIIDFTMKYEKTYCVKDEIFIGEAKDSIPCDYRGHWTYFYKNTVLVENDLSYPVGIKIAEDIAFVEKCHFCANSKKSINKVCYNYWHNKVSVINTTDKISVYYEHIKFANHLKGFYAKYGREYSSNYLKDISGLLPELCAKNTYKKCKEFLVKNEFMAQINDMSMSKLNKKQRHNVKSWLSHPYFFWFTNKIFYSLFLIIKKNFYYNPIVTKNISYIKYKFGKGYCLRKER